MEKRYSTADYKSGLVSGYCILWDKKSFVPQKQCYESFDRDSITIPDNVCLHSQHDDKVVLGNSAKTLKFEKDERGLKFECELPKSAVATREALERGDLTGASIAFHCQDDEWEGQNRRVKKCELAEVSLVARPVHETQLSYRSKEKPKYHWTDLL